jgi:hypothetical protein
MGPLVEKGFTRQATGPFAPFASHQVHEPVWASGT